MNSKYTWNQFNSWKLIANTLNWFLQVSRCGMIYMEPQTLGWRPIVLSWINVLPSSFTETHKEVLNDMFERFCDPCLALVRKQLKVILLWRKRSILLHGQPWSNLRFIFVHTFMNNKSLFPIEILFSTHLLLTSF